MQTKLPLEVEEKEPIYQCPVPKQPLCPQQITQQGWRTLQNLLEGDAGGCKEEKEQGKITFSSHAT